MNQNSRALLLPPDLPANPFETSSEATAPSSLDAGYYETSEYLIGKVAVGVIFLESNGTVDSSTENWAPQRESQVVSEIQTGLSWLANYEPNAHVSFAYDIHYKIPTRYEPINRPHTDRNLWSALRLAGNPK